MPKGILGRTKKEVSCCVCSKRFFVNSGDRMKCCSIECRKISKKVNTIKGWKWVNNDLIKRREIARINEENEIKKEHLKTIFAGENIEGEII